MRVRCPANAGYHIVFELFIALSSLPQVFRDFEAWLVWTAENKITRYIFE
jgi:hypothetical protein